MQGALRGRLEGPVHLLHRDAALQFEHRIGERGIEQRHPHGMAIQLALQLREDHPDRLGRSSGGGDQALATGAGPAQVALKGIHHHLGVGDIVEGGDRTVFDPEALVHHLHHRCQAVGGAGGGGDQPVDIWIVEMVVDAEHDVEHLGAGDYTLHGAGHHHAVEAHRIEIGLQGFRRLELTAAFEHHLHPGLAPGHGGGVRLLAIAHRGVGDDEALAVVLQTRIRLSSLRPAAMHRIKRQQMGGGGGITGRIIDVDQFNAGPPPEGTEDEAADAPEAVDADFHGMGSESAGRRRNHRSTRVDG